MVTKTVDSGLSLKTVDSDNHKKQLIVIINKNSWECWSPKTGDSDDRRKYLMVGVFYVPFLFFSNAFTAARNWKIMLLKKCAVLLDFFIQHMMS